MVLPDQKVLPLDECKAEEHDALFIPGGLGCDNELSDFASQSIKANMSLQADVEKVIKDFLNNKKIIGLCSNSPILIAKAI